MLSLDIWINRKHDKELCQAVTLLQIMISGWVKFSLHKWRVDEGVPGTTERRQNYKIKTERQRGGTGEAKSKKKDEKRKATILGCPCETAWELCLSSFGLKS